MKWEGGAPDLAIPRLSDRSWQGSEDAQTDGV